jgi:hypothetical protein
MTVGSSTIAGNTCDCAGAGEIATPGGGIRNDTAGGLQLANSIVSGNEDVNGPRDCAGQVISRGFNLIGTLKGCRRSFIADPSDQLGVDPLLGPLQDNRGPVPTRALLPGSPAIDRGAPDLDSSPFGCPATDARKVARPQDGDGDGVATCDIGAFERRSPGTP